MNAGRIIELNNIDEYGIIDLNDGYTASFNSKCLYRTINFGDLFMGQEVEFYLQRSYRGYLAIEIRPQETETYENAGLD